MLHCSLCPSRIFDVDPASGVPLRDWLRAHGWLVDSDSDAIFCGIACLKAAIAARESRSCDGGNVNDRARLAPPPVHTEPAEARASCPCGGVLFAPAALFDRTLAASGWVSRSRCSQRCRGLFGAGIPSAAPFAPVIPAYGAPGVAWPANPRGRAEAEKIAAARIAASTPQTTPRARKGA